MGTGEEAEYKLGKVKRVQLGKGGIPFLVTHDARTIRFPDPAIKVNDTVKIDLSTGKVADFIRFDTGVIAMATGGRNMVVLVSSPTVSVTMVASTSSTSR